jgi:hypothetical protein
VAGLSKEAKRRAVEDDLPIEILSTLIPTYISSEEIADVAYEALFGRSRKDDEDEGTGEGSCGGINRYIFVGLDSSDAYIDPAGTLLHGARTSLRQLRRARGADPAGYRVRPKTARQKQAAPQSPNANG